MKNEFVGMRIRGACVNMFDALGAFGERANGGRKSLVVFFCAFARNSVAGNWQHRRLCELHGGQSAPGFSLFSLFLPPFSLSFRFRF
jgi:hypothetical protein